MKRKHVVPICLVAVFFCCSKANRNSERSNDLVADSIIVLVDIDHGSRQDLSVLIDKINTFRPKVIALNYSLVDWDATEEDSLLAYSIKKSAKIVLLAYEDDNGQKYVKPHKNFLSAATGVGVSSYFDNENGLVDGYVPLLQNKEGQMLNFAELVAYTYSEKAAMRFRRLKVNQPATIHEQKTLDDFVLLTDDNFTSEDIEGKVIIVGDSKPVGENVFRIRDKTGKVVLVPNTIVVANIVLSCLNEPK